MIRKYLAILVCLLPMWHAQVAFSDREILYISSLDGVNRVQMSNRSSEPIQMEYMIDVTALEYDNRHNCLYYASKAVIKRRCFANTTQPDDVILMDISNWAYVTSMAHDWVSDALYFSDSNNGKIELIRLVYDEHRAAVKRHLRRTIIQVNAISKLAGIAVNPIRGYLFWADVSFVKPALWRANMDGTNARVLAGKPFVTRPRAIAIDYATDTLYWTDMAQLIIGRCDFNGNGLEKFVDVSVPHGLAIYRGLLIFTINEVRAVYAVRAVDKGEYFPE